MGLREQVLRGLVDYEGNLCRGEAIVPPYGDEITSVSIYVVFSMRSIGQEKGGAYRKDLGKRFLGHRPQHLRARTRGNAL